MKGGHGGGGGGERNEKWMKKKIKNRNKWSKREWMEFREQSFVFDRERGWGKGKGGGGGKHIKGKRTEKEDRQTNRQAE